jgi:cell wall-associated NlpC family hydrolase
MCEKFDLPWLIVSWPSGQYAVVSPSGWRAALIGRQWAWKCQDCLSLVRDALWAEQGIAIPDFERDWNWWKDGGKNLIAAHFAEAGFIRLPPGTPPQHCDVFGMQMPGSPVVNHLALFWVPDQILHQLMGRLSRRQLYDGFFQKATRLHLRHERLRK